jgi:hypothetical protein
MSFIEMKKIIDSLFAEDILTPGTYKPIVLIGHTKELRDFNSIKQTLDYLKEKNAKVLTFREILPRLIKYKPDSP